MSELVFLFISALTLISAVFVVVNTTTTTTTTYSSRVLLEFLLRPSSHRARKTEEVKYELLWGGLVLRKFINPKHNLDEKRIGTRRRERIFQLFLHSITHALVVVANVLQNTPLLINNVCTRPNAHGNLGFGLSFAQIVLV